MLEYGDAGCVGVGNDHKQLAEADVVARILLDEPQGAAAVAVALAAGGDEQAEFGAVGSKSMKSTVPIGLPSEQRVIIRRSWREA